MATGHSNVAGMEETLRVVKTLFDSEGPISFIQFSPDGNRMAAASLDGNVYMYSVLENFKLEVKGDQQRSPIVDRWLARG